MSGTPPAPRVARLWESPAHANAYAELRSTLSPPVRRLWGEAFRAAAPPFPVRRALDVGCGTGRFTTLLAESLGATAVGLDGALAMLRARVIPPGAPVAFAGAVATALPLGAATADVALVSMVYHLLFAAGEAAAAVRELARVLRPGGRVLVRTASRELADTIPWLPFFPGAREISEPGLPPRRHLTATFEADGFRTLAHRTLEQEFAASAPEALEKVRRRVFSTLHLLPDAAFAEGLARYARHCRAAPAGPVLEPVDFFVFERGEAGRGTGTAPPAGGATRGSG